MKVLSGDWFLRGWPDDEMKHWKFKAFEQYVNQQFEENKAYPALGSVLAQLEMIDWWEKEQHQFKTFENYFETPSAETITHKKQWVNKDDLMQHFDYWASKIKPSLNNFYKRGHQIIEEIQSQTSVEYPLIEAQNKKQGWVVITNDTEQQYYFKYNAYIIPRKEGCAQQLHTEFRGIFPKNQRPLQEGLFEHFYLSTIKLIPPKDYSILQSVLPYGKKLIYNNISTII